MGNEDTWTFKGLREGLAHGISALWEERGIDITDSVPESYVEYCYRWAIFELDGLDRQRRDVLKIICGDAMWAVIVAL